VNTLIYILIFIIGTLFGSFFSLAIYRIPLKQDIMHKRSFCPKCGHRLEFLDLIPILSYILLKGKCRYCKQKIKPSYLILELLSGITFLLLAIGVKIDIYNLQTWKIVYLAYSFIYISTLFIIGGIEKNYHTISKPVLLFGLIINAIYIVYLYIIKFSIYKYVIYLGIIIILLIIETIILKRKHQDNYTIQILLLCFYLAMATNEYIVILSTILTLFLIAIENMILNKKDNKQNIIIKNEIQQIPIGYYLCLSNVLILTINNLL
jgi:leader peptidase (prepilin peptidase)/N-methyltransferase